jgi:general secretion pathway protein J
VRARGFTLLELLVAIAVLALLSALSFRGLGSVLDTEARLQGDSRLWNDLSLCFAQFDDDLSMAVDRPVRGSDDAANPGLVLAGHGGGPAAMEGAQLVFTRLGVGEGGVAQSVPRRVGYRLREGKLEYLVWPSLDIAPGARPAVYVLLEHVRDARWQALDAQGRWLDAWPAGSDSSVLPRAVAVRLTISGGEEVSRLVALK